MTNKIRCILGSIFGWVVSLIFMLAFKDNTKKSMTIYCQAICIAIVQIGWIIVSTVLKLIPYVGLITIPVGIVVHIGCVVFIIMNIIKACQYDTVQSTEIPLFGKMANAIFGKVIANGVDFEPVEANGGAVDPNMNGQPNPNMNVNPNMNAQPNPNMNPNGPVNPTQPQQPFNNPNGPTNMNQ